MTLLGAGGTTIEGDGRDLGTDVRPTRRYRIVSIGYMVESDKEAEPHTRRREALCDLAVTFQDF